MRNKLRETNWYPYAVAACIAVLLYVALTHLNVIGHVTGVFVGYFTPIILGCILAYLTNPLARMYDGRVLKKMGKEKLRWTLSVVLAILTLILVIAFMLGTLIPQLANSVSTLVKNMDGYLASLQSLLDRLGISGTVRLDKLLSDLFGTNGKISQYLMDSAQNILNASLAAGKGVLNFFIAIILSVYMLMAKESLKRCAARLLKALMPEKRYDKTVDFLSRCDNILVQYVVFSLLDSLIVGVANAAFMAILGMQYVGLVSMVIAVTNLIPTFGPLIGGAIGGFILLLVNPLHALIFVIFAIALQFIDGYILKPKLFSGSLGVSGLLILAAVIVFGNMFGIAGILLAIPIAAILDFICGEELMPALERRRARIDAEQ